jgi:dihydroorotase
MAPPLRSAVDVEACRVGLADGTIDVIATDHAPHAVHEKEVDFVEAPCGILGLETALPLVMELVREERLTPLELMRRMSTTAARILKVPGGSLAEGVEADIVIIDPERRWVYDAAKGYSKSRNSPWDGEAMVGRVVSTLVGGQLVYHCDRGVLVQ